MWFCFGRQYAGRRFLVPTLSSRTRTLSSRTRTLSSRTHSDVVIPDSLGRCHPGPRSGIQSNRQVINLYFTIVNLPGIPFSRTEVPILVFLYIHVSHVVRKVCLLALRAAYSNCDYHPRTRRCHPGLGRCHPGLGRCHPRTRRCHPGLGRCLPVLGRCHPVLGRCHPGPRSGIQSNSHISILISLLISIYFLCGNLRYLLNIY